MKKFFLIIILMCLNGFTSLLLAVSLELPNQLAANFIPKIKYDNETNEFIYEYILVNFQNSQRPIIEVFIPLKGDLNGKTLKSLQGPREMGVVGYTDELGVARVSWLILDFNSSSDADDDLPPLGVLNPGEQLSGFSFRTSAISLPMIQDFFARGWVRDITEEEAVEYFSNIAGKKFTNLDEVPDELVRASPLGQPVHERAFRGKTVAPEVVSENQLQPLPLTERLISLKDEAASLGWIKSPGIVTSLNQKLKNALKDLKKGNQEAASGVLKAFLNELEAQKGKHINENAYWLLRANAEFLIDRLE